LRSRHSLTLLFSSSSSAFPILRMSTAIFVTYKLKRSKRSLSASRAEDRVRAGCSAKGGGIRILALPPTLRVAISLYDYTQRNGAKPVGTRVATKAFDGHICSETMDLIVKRWQPNIATTRCQRRHSADGVSTSLLHPPLPALPAPSRAADLFPLFCSWLSFH
jgi:hypothetical protein